MGLTLLLLHILDLIFLDVDLWLLAWDPLVMVFKFSIRITLHNPLKTLLHLFYRMRVIWLFGFLGGVNVRLRWLVIVNSLLDFSRFFIIGFHFWRSEQRHKILLWFYLTGLYLPLWSFNRFCKFLIISRVIIDYFYGIQIFNWNLELRWN